MTEPIHSGYMSELQKKVFKTQWVRRWFILYPSDITLGVRLFVYEDKEPTTDGHTDVNWWRGNRQPLYVLSRISCVKRMKLKEQEVLEVSTVGGKGVCLACVNQWERNAWNAAFLRALQTDTGCHELVTRSPSTSMSTVVNNDALFSENDVYESGEIGCIFSVGIVPTDSANRHHLMGQYELHVNTRSLSIIDSVTQTPVLTWPYKYIRRYGRSKFDFSLEAGRRCESGEGFFSFSTDRGNDLFMAVYERASRMKETERTVHENMQRLSLTSEGTSTGSIRSMRSSRKKRVSSAPPVGDVYAVPNRKTPTGIFLEGDYSEVNVSDIKERPAPPIPKYRADYNLHDDEDNTCPAYAFVTKTGNSEDVSSQNVTDDYTLTPMNPTDKGSKDTSIFTANKTNQKSSIVSLVETFKPEDYTHHNCDEYSLGEELRHFEGAHIANDNTEYSYADNLAPRRPLAPQEAKLRYDIYDIDEQVTLDGVEEPMYSDPDAILPAKRSPILTSLKLRMEPVYEDPDISLQNTHNLSIPTGRS